MKSTIKNHGERGMSSIICRWTTFCQTRIFKMDLDFFNLFRTYFILTPPTTFASFASGVPKPAAGAVSVHQIFQ